MIDWQIRPATYHDCEAAADLWLSARRASVPSIPAPAGTDDEVRMWMREVVFPGREVWLAFDRDKTVGLLVLDTEWLDELYVAPGRTGEGIGTALLDLAKHRRRGGFGLWVAAGNVAARRFYERHGLQPAEPTNGPEHDARTEIEYTWSPRTGAPSGPASPMTTPHDQ